MNTELFKNENFGEIRVLKKDGKEYFVGVDVAKCLQYSNPSKAVIDHCKGVTKIGIPSNGGVQETNVITEGDLYRLIIKSKMPESQKFEEWVFDEVLPAIRKTGGYVAEDRAIDFVNNWLPQVDDVSRNAIATVLEENRRLVLQIEEQKPMVEYAEQVGSSSDSISVGDFAKLVHDENIKIGRNKLFKWLKGNSMLQKDNVPYQRYIDNGVFEVIQNTYTTPYGNKKLSFKTKVTGKGQIYLTEKLRAEFGCDA